MSCSLSNKLGKLLITKDFPRVEVLVVHVETVLGDLLVKKYDLSKDSAIGIKPGNLFIEFYHNNLLNFVVAV